MQGSTEVAWQPSRRLERGNAAEQILDDLRGRILHGQLPRGSKLPTEKQLAEAYGVSGPTVREAIRGLSTARLVEVRHGSGAYVTADSDQLIGTSLSSMMQLERVGFADVLSVLAVLMTHAAELAAAEASEQDINALHAALDRVDQGADAETIAGGLRAFVDALAKASGNALLAVLCRFLASVQVSLAKELSGDSFDVWKKTTSKLARERRRLVDAIGTRDASAAREAAHLYSKRSAKVIMSMPAALDATLSDRAMAGLLGSLLQNR
ncbi:FadR/GntR family transcriptional regulator [Paraburkholderia sp. J41]|uniref:FadR/GntR family transcriptional regulator n=1 Tax=Paraburkholderia sp. J41 TaxID=2805433 RepID=UPI002AC31490|nr:GntR family transcriptional regulator [Paraburkholderia sp. J41]